jgi:flagellar biosynthesis regulator FlaF
VQPTSVPAAPADPIARERAHINAEEHSAALAAAAAALREARRQGRRLEDLVLALEQSLELWVAIQTTIKQPDSRLAPAVRTNLQRLGDFVIGTILREGAEIADGSLESLININTQIALGLSEGLRAAA